MNNLCLILNESLMPILDWIVQFLKVAYFSVEVRAGGWDLT